jgi:hypothetical protein
MADAPVFKKAEKLDDVKGRINEILAYFKSKQSPLGYFAALYTLVANAIEEAVKNKDFEHTELLVDLDIIFVNYYIDAMNCAASNEKALPHWQVCIDAAHNPNFPVVEHLLLAMNAHINYDLGTAVKYSVPADMVAAFKKDFFTVNSILFSLLDRVQTNLGRINPILEWYLRFGRKIDDVAASGVMSQMRENAFGYSCLLSLCNNEQCEKEKSERLTGVTNIALDLVKKVGWFKQLVVRIARFFERGTVSTKIDDLLK